MARISLIALLAVVLSGVSHAAPPSQQELIGGSSLAFASWAYKDCGSSSDIVKIDYLTVSPDPPEPGKDLTVTVKAENIEDIQDGAYADVVVKLGYVKLLTKQFDVCEEARNANASIQCPVDKGEHELSQTVALPREIPPAKFMVNIKAYTVDDDDLLCLDLIVDFRKSLNLLGW